MGKKKIDDLFGDSELDKSVSSEFEHLLDSQSVKVRKLVPGDLINAEILSIGKTEAFLTTGTPTDGALPLVELLDREKNLNFKIGDKIDVRVVRVTDGEVLLRRPGAFSSQAFVGDLQDAFQLELPVEGRVVELTKGGFRVSVLDQMGFCPLSQMDFRVEEPGSYIGQKYEFLITKYDPSGRNLVVSRRRLLDLRRVEAETEFMQKQKKGDIFQGKIKRIEKYGAFIELDNAVTGLIPISELAWNRINDPRDIVTIDQRIQVMLLSAILEDGRAKISFSLKQGGGDGDPWLRLNESFPVGKIFEGVIERKEIYGFFINLTAGISGLLPKSSWNDLENSQTFEKKKKGDRLVVQIASVSIPEKRISLKPPSAEEDISWKSHSSTNSSQGFGSFGDAFKNDLNSLKLKK